MRYIDLIEGVIEESRAKQISIFASQPDVTVLINPDREQIRNYMRKLQYKVLRGHLDSRLIVWDGEWATHDHIDDSGEFGWLDGIRFSYSCYNDGPGSVGLLGYGRGSAEFPTNPETYDDFTSKAEILEFAQSNPLMQRAFPGARFRI